jgi:hypothetical protein
MSFMLRSRGDLVLEISALRQLVAVLNKRSRNRNLLPSTDCSEKFYDGFELAGSEH